MELVCSAVLSTLLWEPSPRPLAMHHSKFRHGNLRQGPCLVQSTRDANLPGKARAHKEKRVNLITLLTVHVTCPSQLSDQQKVGRLKAKQKEDADDKPDTTEVMGPKSADAAAADGDDDGDDGKVDDKVDEEDDGDGSK